MKIDLEAALELARRDLDNAVATRDAKVAEIDAANAVVDERKAEVRGLELALERHARSTVQSYVGISDDDEEWGALPRTDAAERVLIESGVPLTPVEVTQRLHAHGRTDIYNDVSAALAYLKRRGRADNGDRAQWVPLRPNLPMGAANGSH